VAQHLSLLFGPLYFFLAFWPGDKSILSHLNFRPCQKMLHTTLGVSLLWLFSYNIFSAGFSGFSAFSGTVVLPSVFFLFKSILQQF